MDTIRIDKKTGFAYIPKDVRAEGFEGDVEVIANALTLTFIKPGVTLESAIKSLEIVLKDLALRIEHQKQIDKKEGALGESRPTEVSEDNNAQSIT